MRSRGWRLADGDGLSHGRCAGLVDTSVGAGPESFAPALRQRSLALSLTGSGERTRWLAAGFADALPDDAELEEIEQRALRVIGACSQQAATRRRIGRLSLDLVERDARCDNRRAHLHPREFALLWRLCDAGNQAVPRSVLLRDVWGLRYRPETNSVAVHICRLRRKLATVGLPGAIVTEPGDGGYRLLASGETKTVEPDQRLRDLTWATPFGVGAP